MSELLPVVVGFVLTTVLGGVLGTYLQRRAWDHQNESRLREDELQRAAAVCQSVSELLDKRRYRMLRLLAALRGQGSGTGGPEKLTASLDAYDAVLYEWNDRLNVNLAMVGTYFGEQARDWLEQAYETYKSVGIELETAFRERPQGPALDTVRNSLAELDSVAYRLTLLLTTHLREGTVGRAADQPVPSPR
jgi:hypothetical protein